MGKSDKFISLLGFCESSLADKFFTGKEFIKLLEDVFGGEQRRSNRLHAIFSAFLGDMACSFDSFGKKRTSPSAHLS